MALRGFGNDRIEDLGSLEVGEATTRALTETRFPCGQCGATLHYAVGTDTMKCSWCGNVNQIHAAAEPILELDLHTALRQLQEAPQVPAANQVISCPNCAAEFVLDAHLHAGECPFCGTHVVTSTSQNRPIKPRGLLPFAISEPQARELYRRWLKGLWFAPSALKAHARNDHSLHGVYIPYWTYDSDTLTAYDGQRGDVYYVTERYTSIENGRRVTRTRQVPRIRWTPASGHTNRHFDDVLVGATRTLPRKITDWLEPWDLERLVPYTEDYMGGFSSEVYQVDLDEGFNVAQKLMDNIIRSDVARAIGGDRQRIHRVSTHHSETTFKHVLLPLWSAAFMFQGKSYRFVVNARTGKVRGERPWSRVKIGLAILGGALALAVLVGLMQGNVSTGYGSGMGRSFGDGVVVEYPMDWTREPAPSRWPDTSLDYRPPAVEFPTLPEWMQR